MLSVILRLLAEMVVKLFAMTVARARVLTGLAGGARAGWSACSSAGRNAHSVSRRCMVVITVVHWSREAAARACLLFCGLRARPASWPRVLQQRSIIAPREVIASRETGRGPERCISRLGTQGSGTEHETAKNTTGSI